MTWEKGVSGNLAGRPKGAINKNAPILEALKRKGMTQEDFMETVIDRAMDKEDSASGVCLKLIIERLVPAIKSRDALVKINDFPYETDKQIDRILKLVADGELSTSEASKLSGLIGLKQSSELSTQLSMLEDRLNGSTIESN
jgi:hypothetical protein